MRHHILSPLVLLLALVSSLILTLSPLQAQPLSGEADRAAFPDFFAPVEGCNAVASAAGISRTSVAAAAQPLFYSVPMNILSDDGNEVIVKVFTNGALYVQESFRFERRAVEEAHREQRQRFEKGLEGASADIPELVQEAAVFELLADRSAVRATLLEMSAEAKAELAIEVLVNGGTVLYQGWADFAADSGEQLQQNGLPTAVKATATVFQTEATPGNPQEFFVCGDGFCGGGSPPLGETCETCPQDCGGPCSVCGNGFCGVIENCGSCPADCGPCAICPKDLGTEGRIDNLGTTILSVDCMNGWAGQQYYLFSRQDLKIYSVQRTEQCNGTITETEVPGSATYSSTYCWDSTSSPCSFGFGYASTPCF
ncbi:MAG: hypothetical protein AAGD01_05990 [Acidobacteriota bacterium]